EAVVADLVAEAPLACIGKRGILDRLSTERRDGDDSHLRAVATLGFVEPLRQALFLGRRQGAREIAHPSVRRDRVLAPPRRTTREQGEAGESQQPGHDTGRHPSAQLTAAVAVSADALSFDAVGAEARSDRMSSVGATSAPSVAAS